MGLKVKDVKLDALKPSPTNPRVKITGGKAVPKKKAVK